MISFDVLTSGKPPSLETLERPPVAELEVLDEDEHPAGTSARANKTEPQVPRRNDMIVQDTWVIRVGQSQMAHPKEGRTESVLPMRVGKVVLYGNDTTWPAKSIGPPCSRTKNKKGLSKTMVVGGGNSTDALLTVTAVAAAATVPFSATAT